MAAGEHSAAGRYIQLYLGCSHVEHASSCETEPTGEKCRSESNSPTRHAIPFERSLKLNGRHARGAPTAEMVNTWRNLARRLTSQLSIRSRLRQQPDGHSPSATNSAPSSLERASADLQETLEEVDEDERITLPTTATASSPGQQMRTEVAGDPGGDHARSRAGGLPSRASFVDSPLGKALSRLSVRRHRKVGATTFSGPGREGVAPGGFGARAATHENRTLAWGPPQVAPSYNTVVIWNGERQVLAPRHVVTVG